MDLNDDVSVRIQGHSVNSFRANAYPTANPSGQIKEDHNKLNGIKPGNHQNGSFVEEVEDADSDVFHPMNRLFGRKNINVYKDNSDSDSDTVLFDRKYSTNSQESFDSSGNEAQFQTKPLMHPRKRTKTKVRTRQTKGCLQRCVWPFLYVIFFLGAVVAMGLAIVYLVNFFNKASSLSVGKDSVIGCSHVTKNTVWTKGIPKLVTESSFRMVDVNSDGVLDILFGFATGIDGYYVDEVLCDVYFNGTRPCRGGVLALDGQTAAEIWRHYTDHEVFGLNCGYDLDQDGVKDCLAGGRVATFEVISGKTGKKIWSVHTTELVEEMNFYTGQFVPDLDGDQIPDILNIHGGDPFGEPGSETRQKGKLFLFSGRTGDVLQVLTVPDGRESYYSPVVFYRRGQLGVLFGTGGETHGGSLWYITLTDLYKGRIQKAIAIYTDPFKGIMTPPVLIDMTGDRTLDIVFLPFNSSSLLVDGDSLQILWNYTLPASETYSTPAPAYYTDDDIPDFMVHWQHGPGFPVYFYSVTTVLDGSTGQPIPQPYIKDAVGAQSSPLTVSVEGFGNDLFLYLTSDCLGFEGQDGEFSFVKGTNVHEQSRADICHLKFNSEGVSQLNAVNRHMDKAAVLYNSIENKALERSTWINTTAEALEFLASHPEHMQQYMEWKEYYKKYMAQGSSSTNPGDDLETSADVETPNNGEFDEEAYNSLSDLIKRVLNSDDSASKLQLEDNQDLSMEDVARLLNGIKSESETDQSEAQPIRTSAGERLTDSTINGYTNDIEKERTQARPSQNFASQSYDERLSENTRGRDISRTGGGNSQGLRRTYPSSEYDQDYIVRPSPNRLQDYGSLSRGSYFDDTPRLGSLSGRRYTSGIYDDDNTLQSYRGRNPYQTRKNPFQESGYESYKNRGSLQSRPSENVRTNSRKKGLGGNWQSLSGRRKRNAAAVLSNQKKTSSKRKRHVGPHDNGGLQRLISTGTLAPTLLPTNHPAYNQSIDVIFATYWFYPAKTEMILPEDHKCIDKKMAQQQVRFDPKSKYYGMDDDGYDHAVTHECLELSGHVMPEGGVYNSQGLKDPYVRHMGQLTLYRLTLTCDCEGDQKMKVGSTCSRVLPYDQQQWPAYMGQNADSVWLPRKSNSPT